MLKVLLNTILQLCIKRSVR